MFKKVLLLIALLCLIGVSSFAEKDYIVSKPLKSQADVTKISNKSQGIRVVFMPPASEYNFYRTIGQGIES